jgi:PTS system nitrogen regulatory IIA component
MKKTTIDSFAALLDRGGFLYDIPGDDKMQVLKNLVNALPDTLASGSVLDKSALLKAVMEREALMSTSIGNGVALPHPREPLIDKQGDQFVTLAALTKPVDWYGLDGKPVDTLFLIVSASAKLHLHTLSSANYFCQQPEFLAMLKDRAQHAAILDYMRKVEADWK